MKDAAAPFAIAGLYPADRRREAPERLNMPLAPFSLQLKRPKCGAGFRWKAL
jgi:hypothetical protein